MISRKNPNYTQIVTNEHNTFAFELNAGCIDKSLPVPVGRQLYGLLSYQLSHGDLRKGTRLPSVRQLARTLGIAQATVAQVYKDLRDAGLLEMRHGAGAFTRLAMPADADLRSGDLRADIARLLNRAEHAGISPMALVGMVNAQAQLRYGAPGLTIVFVAIFEGPGRAYLDAITPHLLPSDRVTLLTTAELAEDPAARAACQAADLVLTFVHRTAEVSALVPAANVMGLRFIPSDATRQALAALDPRARVAAITHIEDYIAIMRPSVQRFAPHVSDITVSWSHAPDLKGTIARSDAVIYASGADHVAAMVRPGTTCFEYRHMPDPAGLEADLEPRLADLRAGRRLRVVEGGLTKSADI